MSPNLQEGPISKRALTSSHLLLALLLVFPSLGFIQKHAGLAGLVAYTLAATALLVWLFRHGSGISAWTERHFHILAAVSVVGLVFGYVLLHPLEDNKGPGKSSDRDEGLEMAVHRMISGESPYYPSNRTAGPLSVLPGSIVLAAPFVAMRDSGYQNVFWLALFMFATAWRFRDKYLVLCLVAVPLAISPAAQYEFISGGDLIANGIFVALFFLFALDTWSHEETPRWQRLLSCLLLGLGVASRANFLFLMPLFATAIWSSAGFNKAFVASMLVTLTAASITLPIYLAAPLGFTPLMTRKKLEFANESFPWAGTSILVATVVVALWGAIMLLRGRNGDVVSAFFRWCTWITITPMLMAVVISSVISKNPDFSFMRDRFGLMYVFFALLGWRGLWRIPAGRNRECKSAPA